MSTRYPYLTECQIEKLHKLRAAVEEAEYDWMVGAIPGSQLTKAKEAVDKFLASIARAEEKKEAEKAAKKAEAEAKTKAEELRKLAESNKAVEDSFMEFFWKKAEGFAKEGRTSVTVKLPTDRTVDFCKKVAEEGCTVIVEGEDGTDIICTVKW